MFVVAGSSGQTGSVVADRLLRRGERVRLIARDPAKLSGFQARGAELASADLNDGDALASALRGASGAYLLLPPYMAAPDLLGMHRKLIASFVHAIGTSQLEHVVCLSSIGAHQTRGTGPVESLHALERALSQVSANVTFVRAAYFMESLASSLAGVAGGVFPSFLRADLPVAMVAARDAGMVSAEALLRGPGGHRIIELEGPRRYTAIEAASELSTLVCQPLRVQELPESAIVPTMLALGLSPQVAQLSFELLHAINSGYLSWEHGAAARVRGTTLIHEVLAQLLAARSAAPS